jgi:hypothetical protein
MNDLSSRNVDIVLQDDNLFSGGIENIFYEP